MNQKISEPVSVLIVFDHQTHLARPRQIIWNNKTYPVTQLGLRHCYRNGRKLIHVFSLVSNNIFFRLGFDSENLSWTVEEVSDGLPE